MAGATSNRKKEFDKSIELLKLYGTNERKPVERRSDNKDLFPLAKTK